MLFSIRNLPVVLLSLAATPIVPVAGGGNHSDSEFVHEWAGVFPLADATHQYLMQSINGSYPDPNMKIVLIPTTDMTMEGIHTTEGGVAALMEGDGTCETLTNGGTGSAIGADGSCFDLVVNKTLDTNIYTLTTDGLEGVALYTQHVPYEFERDMHFFKDSEGKDIEPTQEETMAGHGHGSDHGHKDHADGHGDADDHGHGHAHGPDHDHTDGHVHDETSGAANFGGLVGSAVAGAIVAAAL